MINEAALRAAYAALLRRVEYLERSTGLFVADEMLDRPKGDPRVKFVPRNWRGDNFKGAFYSACSPEFLEVLAETLTWMADNPQAGKEDFVPNNRRDAARARTWARRLRAQAAAEEAKANGPVVFGAETSGSQSSRQDTGAAGDPGSSPGGSTQVPPHDPVTGEVFDFDQSDDFTFPSDDDSEDDFQFDEAGE